MAGVNNSEKSHFLAKCIELCDLIVRNSDKDFLIKVTIGNDFDFTVKHGKVDANTSDKNTVVKRNKKYVSPSTKRRNLERLLEFKARKNASKIPDKNTAEKHSEKNTMAEANNEVVKEVSIPISDEITTDSEETGVGTLNLDATRDKDGTNKAPHPPPKAKALPSQSQRRTSNRKKGPMAQPEGAQTETLRCSSTGLGEEAISSSRKEPSPAPHVFGLNLRPSWMAKPAGR